MYEKLLTDSGLTNNEAKVYLALLKIGKSQSGRIVQEAKISGGKVYETLYKLVNKGLVEMVVDNGVKQFCASDPESILLYIKEKKEEIEQQAEELSRIVPDLQKIRKLEEQFENVYLIKGFRGIKPIVYAALDKAKGEVQVMGVRSSKRKKFNTFWQHWHKERVKQKKNAKVLFTDKGTPYWDFFKKLKFTQLRYTPQLSPAAIMIIDSNSFIFSYEEELTCIHISSETIAKSLSSFFDGLWSMAKS